MPPPLPPPHTLVQAHKHICTNYMEINLEKESRGGGDLWRHNNIICIN